VAHILRGMTLKTLLGLEDEHVAFKRYRAIRQAERNYVWSGDCLLHNQTRGDGDCLICARARLSCSQTIAANGGLCGR